MERGCLESVLLFHRHRDRDNGIEVGGRCKAFKYKCLSVVICS